jgi:uncharacterized protein YjiS (DUF1127 family)
MSQIDREMEQIERGPRSVMLFSMVGALPTGLYGERAPQRLRKPWLPRAWRTLTAASLHAVDAILTWRERARTRRQLLMLDDRLLKDMGITRLDAQSEAEKPFWRV